MPEVRKRDCLARAKAILADLGIEGRRLSEYPYQLSGGMRQRIMIGLALILHPDILLADEPTTALDVIVEAGFTELLMKLKRQYDLTVLLISHNLGLVAEMADRIAVMYGGRIAELASVDDIFARPLHPYTHGPHGLRAQYPPRPEGARGDAGEPSRPGRCAGRLSLRATLPRGHGGLRGQDAEAQGLRRTRGRMLALRKERLRWPP